MLRMVAGRVRLVTLLQLSNAPPPKAVTVYVVPSWSTVCGMLMAPLYGLLVM